MAVNHAPGEHRHGLLWALAGFAVLSCGDAVVKTAAGQWAPTAFAFSRYALGMIGLGVLLAVREGLAGFRMPSPPIQLLRGFGVAMATVGFFSAVFVMPLASATTITFTSPMITAVLSALFLGEPAKRETWLASIIAFIGVLIVLRPNFAALGPKALLPLLSALGMSLLMIGNRATAGKSSPLAAQFFVALFATPVLLVAMLAGHASGMPTLQLAWPAWSVFGRSAVVAVSATIAHWAIFQGTTRAGAAAVAPMTYIQLITATALGCLVFGNRPDALTFAGAALIVGAGLWLLRSSQPREAKA